MRILQISSARTFGGGEKHLVDLINGLSAGGHEVFLAAPQNSPLRERLTSFPDEHFISVNINSSLDIFAARRLANVIREKNIDIVHAHVARDYLPASLAVRFAPSARFVLTRHVLFPMNSLHRFALSNVTRVIAVSRSVQKQLVDEKIFPGDKVVAISNGIDIAHWANTDHEEARRSFREKHNLPPEAMLIGSVGELKKLKGQEDLILAAEMVLQKFPDAHFVIVGKDNSIDGEYGDYLKNLAAAIGAPDRFIWLDWVEDTAPLLHSLDVFVSPSHSESFGLAILEAMASGCAVVATETGGAKELLGSEQPLPIGDPVKIATRTCELLANETMRDQSGKDLQNRAIENFDVKNMIRATEELYLKL